MSTTKRLLSNSSYINNSQSKNKRNTENLVQVTFI